MRNVKFAVLVLGLSLFLAACSDSGSDDPPPPGGGLNQDPPADTPSSWTVIGTIEFPAGETASNLKLRAVSLVPGTVTKEPVSNTVALTLSGTPPMASFQVSIDVSSLSLSDGRVVDLEVFNDTDGNDILGLDEGRRGLIPLDLTCAVWSDGLTRSDGARFKYYLAGSGNTTLTGWYYANCSDPNSCLNRVTTTDNTLSNAVLGYSVNLTPIQP